MVVVKYKMRFEKITKALVDFEDVQQNALLMSQAVALIGLIDKLFVRGIAGLEAYQETWVHAHKNFELDIDEMYIV